MKKIFHKFQSRSGQHIIEYALLIILIMAGIIAMGPYVINSWNANLQGYDDSVQDSIQEDISSSPEGNFVADCTCAMEPPCPTPPCCGYGSVCTETQATIMEICSPIGCSPSPAADQCSSDSACCSTPAKLPVPFNCGASPCGPDEVPASFSCGSGGLQWVCLYDPNCAFECTGGPVPVNHRYKGLCQNDDLALTSDTPFTMVRDSAFLAGPGPASCSPGLGTLPKCEVECMAPFVPGAETPPNSGVFTNCECPETYVEVSVNACICPNGMVEQGSCPTGFCEQGICPIGFCQDSTIATNFGTIGCRSVGGGGGGTTTPPPPPSGD